MRAPRFALLLSALTVATAAHAAIVANTGSSDVLIAGPGVGYTPDFFDDPVSVVHGWDETQNVTLTSGLAVDVTMPGTYFSIGGLTPGVIAAGTVVNSHTLYFDPVGGSVSAGFQFDGTILGVVLIDDPVADPFVASDFLIPASVPPGNVPPSTFAARGCEISPNADIVTVGVNTIKVDLSAGSPGDQVRVLTAVVPEPFTMVGFGTLAAALMARRRHRS
ncbi:MAG: PEP-CTERM sorting domain-containing protein [Armatimonadetes bacterium]|nr:PEP-CTERM sorting domain-containing protein [Armatimonadota bacterium]